MSGTAPDAVGLHLVRGVDVEELAAALGARLASTPPADPFAAIEVAVPSVGMARWLSQRLSHHLGAVAGEAGEAGVAAGIELPFLGQIVGRTLAATLDRHERRDPWPPEQLQWAVLALLDTLPGEAVYAPLHAHLTEGGARIDRRRLPLARRIAELFDRYALHRPGLLAAWHEGRLVDAADQPLAADLHWQPALWRSLSEQLSIPSPDRRLVAAVAALRGTGGRDGAGQGVARPEELPGPVTVFGVMGMSSGHLELLAALAGHTRVELYLLAPVPAWWSGAHTRATVARPAHPLLATSGMNAWQASAALAEVAVPRAASVTDLDADRPRDGVGPQDRPGRLLATLQADLRADRPRGGDGAPPPVHLDPSDTSLQVHACHGPVRQLEVLREVLLGLLEEDPSLEPRDIVVLTPDIATYAPLVAAAFPTGRADAPGEEPPALPVRVADRTVRPGNQVAETLDRVLALVTARVGASEVLDLLASPAVLARFGLGAEDLDTLAEWVLGTGVRWGIDRDHRRALVGLDDGAHTWDAGLDRLALGAATIDDGVGTLGGVVPYDDVEGGGVAQLGRLLTATDTLFATLRTLEAPRSRAAWRQALGAALDALCDPGDERGGDPALREDLAAVRDDLAHLLAADAPGGGEQEGPELTLEEVRWLLAAGLGTRGASTPYGTGAVTVSGLVPLRNLPHRVVCLVGLDDGVLPGPAQEHGFDLLVTDPRPGDPDPRLEQRQLFLDALLAARDHLVLTYTGHDPRTNEPAQPAVPVAELLDVLERTAHAGGSGRGVAELLVVHHPLQPYSASYFQPGGPGDPPQAFDPGHLAAARAARGTRPGLPGFVQRPLPDLDDTVLDPAGVELSAVVSTLQHPLRALLQHRLGLRLGEDDRRIEDRDPTELGGLQRWQISQQLLERRRSIAPDDGWQDRLLAAGTVPVGGPGVVALQGVEERVAAVEDALAAADGPEEEVGIDLLLDPLTTTQHDHGAGAPAGTQQLRLTGSVTLTAGRLVLAQMSTIRAKHRLAAWVQVLAAAAARPDLEVEAVLIGPPAGDADEATVHRLVPSLLVPEEGSLAATARDHLAGLVGVHLRALTTALPLLPETAHALVAAAAKGEERPVEHHTVRSAWDGVPGRRGRSGIPGERDDAYVVQALGTEVELEAVLADHPGLEAEMARIWEPILAAEGGS